MSGLAFDRDALLARLDRLDPNRRRAFAVACAERLLPLYRRFHEQTGRGAPEVLEEALQIARAHLDGSVASETDLTHLADRCEALVPTEDDSWSEEAGLAQNAAAAVAYALRDLLSGSAQDAVWTALQGYEASDLIASCELDADFNVPGVEDRILGQEVVQRELTAQEDLLSRLERGERV